MSIRDKAVEAAIREFVKPRMHSNESYGKLRADLGAALDAALAVLHPTVPNDVAALDALPVGTVLRGVDGSVRTRAPGGGWVKGAPLTGVRTADLVNIGTYKCITEWLVIYQPEEER